jgi:anhydro-N-acetylmuramic acid kinase
MSGTSMDGIDAVLLRLSDTEIAMIGSHSRPWPEDIRQQMLALATPGENEIDRLGALDVLAGRQFGAAALELLSTTGISASDVTAIGSHGQTIRHRPEASPPFTLQIGDPNSIAEQTGITTIADFRRRDMATGGEGAPLVPAFHANLFQHPDEARAVLNIGGIANLTLLPKSGNGIVTGFDTGPGNCLLDSWIRHHQGQPYDKNGNWAASGKPHAELLATLLGDSYFQRSPPKSTGPEHFSLNWLEGHLAPHPKLPTEDIQATLTTLTAESISQALHNAALDCERLLVCGGGIHNNHLIEELRSRLGQLQLESTETYGVHPDWVEAAAFAWLARRTIRGETGNLSSVTGASHPSILGGIYPA